MDRRFGAVALTALLFLTGCSFLGAVPGGPGTGTPAQTATATATPSPSPTATATPTDSPTARPEPLPAGYSPTGVDNLSVALERHRTALVDTGSFTISYQATLLTDRGRSAISSVRSTNVTQALGYEATNITNGATRERFLTDGTAYVRTNPAGGDVYYNQTSNAEYDPARYTAVGLVRPALENVTYKNAERIERGNRTFFRFRASDVRDLESLLGAGVSPTNVTSFDAAIVVAADGSVQRVGYQATVERGDEEFAVQVRIDVIQQGDVVLGEPVWLDEAKQST